MSFENKDKQYGNNIRSGAIWNTIGSMMMAANTVLLTMLVGHYSTMGDVGIFTLALTSAQVLYSVGLFGANDLQMTDYSHRYRFAEYFGTRMISTVASVILCAAVVPVLDMGGEGTAYLCFLTAFMLVNSFAELYQSMFFQCRRMDLTGKSLFFRYLISTAAFAVCLILSGSVVTSCIAMLAADVIITLVWILIYAGSYRDSGYSFKKEDTVRLLKEAAPLGISLLTSLVLLNAPKYLIYVFISDVVQGAYTILFMPVYAVNLVSQFIFKPFLYRYSALISDNDYSGFKKLLFRQVAVVAVLDVCGAFIFRLIGPWMLKLLFGQDLAEYRNMMFLFMISGGLMAVNQLLYYILVIMGKQKAILRNYLISAAAAVLIGIICVPAWQILGAWVCFTAGQLLLTVSDMIVIKRKYGGMS